MTPVPERLISAALSLAAERGWRTLSLAEVAKSAGIDLIQAYDAFRDKTDLLAGILAHFDRAVLREGAADAQDPPRDRLFEVLMRRFDALQGHRAGVKAVLRDLPREPIALLAAWPRLATSMAWALQAAGLSAEGVSGMLRALALAVIYASTLRVWIEDETPDLARTMASLDRALREAEGFVRRCPRLAGTSAAGPMPSPEAPPTMVEDQPETP